MVTRRRFLSTTATSAVTLGSVASVDAVQSDGKQQFTIEQSGKCIPIKPLSTGVPIKKFYDYRTPNTKPPSYKYASFGTRKLQQPNTSILFLYDGPKGLSLVMVHDKVNSNTNGGAVTFRITGLPADGAWVMKDDSYNRSTNLDTFDHSVYRTQDGTKVASSVMSWTWSRNRSDGGVYRGLGDDFKVTIHPAFNEKAGLSNTGGKPYTGTISNWVVLSGDLNNPVQTQLDMNKSVTIRSDGCQNVTTTQTTTTSTHKSEVTTTQTETTQPNQSTTAQGESAVSTSSTSQSTDGREQGQSVIEEVLSGLTAAVNAVLRFVSNLF